MKTVITLIFVVFYLLIVLPLQLVTWILIKLAPKTGNRLANAAASFGFKILEKITAGLRTVLRHVLPAT